LKGHGFSRAIESHGFSGCEKLVPPDIFKGFVSGHGFSRAIQSHGILGLRKNSFRLIFSRALCQGTTSVVPSKAMTFWGCGKTRSA
jgi:hypothetical protein